MKTGAARVSGFGPTIFAEMTKLANAHGAVNLGQGFDRGLGPEAAWIAAQASPLPVFPIGGIAPENADELEHVGRACVGAAILGARDPARAAAAIRLALGG
jgi:hypothetical protein